MAKPDNRSDNEIHLQQHIDHTIANLREAKDYLAKHAKDLSPKEKHDIENKNERRKQSISSFVSEKQDEAQH